MKNSFEKIFQEAPQTASLVLFSVYERIPGSLRRSFSSCVTCVGTGSAGTLVSHAGCVMGPALAGASGTALSSKMMAMMLMTSPAIAAVVAAGIDLWQTRKLSWPRLAGSAAFAFVISVGVNHFYGHDHGPHTTHAQAYSSHTLSQAQLWFDKQIPDHENSVLR